MNELEKHISIVITLCAITLYYIGFFYLDAFLNIFGLSYSQFPCDIHVVLLNGVFYITNALSRLLSINTVYIIFVIMFFWLAKYVYSQDVNLSSSKTAFIRNCIYRIVAIILFIAALIILRFAAIDIGEKEANKFIENHGYVEKSVIKYADNTEIIGYKINCIADRCAYLSDKNIVVIPNEKQVKETNIFLNLNNP